MVNYNGKIFSAQCSVFCNAHETFSKNCYSCSFDRYRTTLNSCEAYENEIIKLLIHIFRLTNAQMCRIFTLTTMSYHL